MLTSYPENNAAITHLFPWDQEDWKPNPWCKCAIQVATQLHCKTMHNERNRKMRHRLTRQMSLPGMNSFGRPFLSWSTRTATKTLPFLCSRERHFCLQFNHIFVRKIYMLLFSSWCKLTDNITKGMQNINKTMKSVHEEDTIKRNQIQNNVTVIVLSLNQSKKTTKWCIKKTNDSNKQCNRTYILMFMHIFWCHRNHNVLRIMYTIFSVLLSVSC